MKSNADNRCLEELARAMVAAQAKETFSWVPGAAIRVMAEAERTHALFLQVRDLKKAEQIAALMRDFASTRNAAAHYYAIHHRDADIVLDRQQYDKIIKLYGAVREAESGTVNADVDAVLGDVSIEARVSRIQMPPGYWMDRIARSVFFFSPKTIERIFEEIVGDFRHEMIKAEARGDLRAMRRLRLQHWGGFIIALIEQLLEGLVGRIIKALKGG